MRCLRIRRRLPAVVLITVFFITPRFANGAAEETLAEPNAKPAEERN